MGNSAWIYGNIADDVEPVAVTAATGYPASYVMDNIVQTYIKSTGTSLRLTWDQGAAKAITAISFHNHNIPATGTQTLSFSADNFSTTAVTVNLTPATDNFFKVFTSASYQYQRTINNVSSGVVQIGEIYMGTLFTPSVDIAPQYRETFRINRSVNIVNGQYFIRNISKHTGFQIEYRGVTSTDIDTFKTIAAGGHCVFIPDLDGTACYHGVIAPEDGQLVITRDYQVSGGLSSIVINFWQNSFSAL